MSARIGFNDFCADGLCPSFCNHRLIKCEECGIEWGWGGDLVKLEQMRDEHNAERHGNDD